MRACSEGASSWRVVGEGGAVRPRLFKGPVALEARKEISTGPGQDFGMRASLSIRASSRACTSIVRLPLKLSHIINASNMSASLAPECNDVKECVVLDCRGLHANGY